MNNDFLALKCSVELVESVISVHPNTLWKQEIDRLVEKEAIIWGLKKIDTQSPKAS